MLNYYAPYNQDALYIDNPEARTLFLEAYREHLNASYTNAINLYLKSITIYPSAQAYTYMAWSYASLKEYEKAIELCQKAISIDPDYGNSLNDLGVYLNEIGKSDEAIEYFKQAIISKKYTSRYFPYYNLGRIYLEKDMIQEAISCLNKSIELNADFENARKELEMIQKKVN